MHAMSDDDAEKQHSDCGMDVDFLQPVARFAVGSIQVPIMSLGLPFIVGESVPHAQWAGSREAYQCFATVARSRWKRHRTTARPRLASPEQLASGPFHEAEQRSQEHARCANESLGTYTSLADIRIDDPAWAVGSEDERAARLAAAIERS